MKRYMPMIMGLLLIVLSACTPMIYGVPQETWERMSEPERIEAMDVYKQRQIARQQAAAERARQHAIYLEEQRRQAAAEAEALQMRVEAIYRGDGNYGDLLRVHVENGLANFRGQERQYSPVTFQIANGEAKAVTFETTKNRRVDLTAFYDGATLILDDRQGKKGNAAQLHYDKRWTRGLTYENVYTNNSAKLKGADITVQVVGEPPRKGHYSHGNTTIIINEQPRERIVYRNQPQTVIIKEQPKTVVIKQQPKTVVIHDKSRETNGQYRQRQQELKNERNAIEQERKQLEREQAQFEAEQRALEQERKDLAEKQQRVRQMKKDAARDRKQVTKERTKEVQEREQAVREMEKIVSEKERAVAKKEKVVAKQEQVVKEKKQKVSKQEKEVEKQEKQVEKEIKALEKDQKYSKGKKDNKS